MIDNFPLTRIKCALLQKLKWILYMLIVLFHGEIIVRRDLIEVLAFEDYNPLQFFILDMKDF